MITARLQLGSAGGCVSEKVGAVVVRSAEVKRPAYYHQDLSF